MKNEELLTISAERFFLCDFDFILLCNINEICISNLNLLLAE